MTDRRAQMQFARQNSNNSVPDALILPHTNRPKRSLSKERKQDAENAMELLRIVPKEMDEDAALRTLCPMTEKEQLEIVQSYTLLQQGVKTDQVTPPPSVKSAVENGFDGKPEDLERYLRVYGPNELPKAEPPSYFCLWINSFKDIMMILLLIAMIILYAVGDPVAASAILVILMIATNIGAYVEYSSNQAAAELGDLPGQSLIRMQKEWVRVSNVELVPGLLVELQTGDIVPADCILLDTARDCSCTEAMLTGESEPVSKTQLVPPDVVKEGDPHLLSKMQEHTRLYMGTEFTGEGVALIVETGERTQMGQIFQSMVDADPELSDLQKMIDKLILVLALLSIAASALNAAICIPTGRGVEPNSDENQALTCVLNSVALTVAAVPENLPVALVIALASIIKNLANLGVIVKSLPAGEELSRLNYVFSDKTGTLTEGVMTARAAVVLGGHVSVQSDFEGPKESEELSSDEATRLADQIRLLAATAQDDLRSNPTGDACKKALPEQLEGTYKRVLLEPASSKTKMARAAMTIKDQNYLVKVGSDWVLDSASRQATVATDLTNFSNNTTQEFDKAVCVNMINTWAKGGYRVICIVAKPVDQLPKEILEDEVGEFGEGFTFLGCLVIQDPPREDVKENIKIIRGAGVVVSMITGDNPITGLSIAQQVGLAGDLSEEEKNMCLINAFELFHGMEEEDCKREIITRLQYSMSNNKGLIIGRVSPFQKRLFVECARAMGLVVAMTGDGANDAPALKMANVGIAMGNGSDIAKAAGDMILVNPSFTGIVEAIRAGRLGFDNILKFLLFLLGTNISEVFVYLTLTFADIVITLDALNLLVLNLLTDGFPAIALSLEKAEGDLMKRSPLARNTSVLNSFTYMSITVTNLALMGSYLTVILLGNLWYLGDLRGEDTSAVENYDEGLEKVRMMFILMINISQLLLGFTHRAPDRSVFSIGFFSGKNMNYASLSSIAIIILMTHLPGLKNIMRTDYPDWYAYLLVVGMSFLPMIVHEVTKVLVFQKYNYNVYSLYKYEYKEKDKDTILKLTHEVKEEQEDGVQENGSADKKSAEESL
jgi:Ca2+-transporting ATPase